MEVDMRSLAKLGATVRLAALDTERKQILTAFPDLHVRLVVPTVVKHHPHVTVGAKFNAAARARLSRAAKRRWRIARAAGKTSL